MYLQTNAECYLETEFDLNFSAPPDKNVRRNYFSLTTSFWFAPPSASIWVIWSDQVYSNTRVPAQVNTNQHESNTSQKKSTRVNMNQHESPTQVNTSQLDQEIIIVYRSLVGEVW